MRERPGGKTLELVIGPEPRGKTLQARRDIDLWTVSQQRLRFAQVGICHGHITGLVWLPIEPCRISQGSLQETNEFEQWHGVRASQVEDFISTLSYLPVLEPSPGADNAIHDIIHVSVITL